MDLYDFSLATLPLAFVTVWIVGRALAVGETSSRLGASLVAVGVLTYLMFVRPPSGR